MAARGGFEQQAFTPAQPGPGPEGRRQQGLLSADPRGGHSLLHPRGAPLRLRGHVAPPPGVPL